MIVGTSASGEPEKINLRILSTDSLEKKPDSFCAGSTPDSICGGDGVARSMDDLYLSDLSAMKFSRLTVAGSATSTWMVAARRPTICRDFRRRSEAASIADADFIAPTSGRVTQYFKPERRKLPHPRGTGARASALQSGERGNFGALLVHSSLQIRRSRANQTAVSYSKQIKRRDYKQSRK